MALYDVLLEDLDAQIEIASNPTTGPNFLERLAESSEKKVLILVAKNLNTEPKIIEKLINKDVFSASELAEIAQRKDLPESVYTQIAKKITENNPKFLNAFKNL